MSPADVVVLAQFKLVMVIAGNALVPTGSTPFHSFYTPRSHNSGALSLSAHSQAGGKILNHAKQIVSSI